MTSWDGVRRLLKIPHGEEAKVNEQHERLQRMERERVERLERYERAKRFAAETAQWPSWKLRAAYAQPEAVRRAEERERLAQERQGPA